MQGSEALSLFINIGLPLLLLLIGYFAGRMLEQRHYQSIRQREVRFRNLPVVSSRQVPQLPGGKTVMVIGCTVVSVDYFKRFLAGLRNIFGGRVTSYESLLDRARRESILRMKAQADAAEAKIIFNVKLETSSIYKGEGKSIGSVEVLAYGTAFIPPKTASARSSAD